MAQSHPAVQPQPLDQVDPVWSRVREEAEVIAYEEPALAGFLFATVINQSRLEDAVCQRLAQRLSHPDVDASLLFNTFDSVIEETPSLGELMRTDMIAVYDRDPACHRFVEPLLYFKGFHAVQTHRFAHVLYKNGRKDFAFYLQSQASRVFSIDIHPAAEIGRGIFVDHGHAIVIGETARVGDDVSMLHGVTLGGTGKDSEDRHPKIADGVMLGAGAKVLGNIKIGKCSRVAAGSVVLNDVPPKKTVAGVPAKIVGEAGCSEPSRTMNQMLLEASGRNG
ncbi:MAG: serine O-acetyltransferase [Hyphomicrobiaceae bacterium]